MRKPCDSSRSVDGYDKNECCNDSNFLDFCTDVAIVMSSSCHPDNSHS